jgi:hypothetical protein
MKRIVLLAGTGLLAVACSPAAAIAPAPAPVAPAALTLQQVIDRNTQARGGAAALDRMHSILMESEWLEDGQKLDLRYAADRAGVVKVEAYLDGKYVGSEGVDKDGVWIMTKQGPKPSVATGAANALTHGAEDKLFGWNRFAERGHKLALLAPETIDGVTYQVVQVRYASGHVSNFYIDPKTWLAVRRRDQRAYHPDVDQKKQQEIETVYSDFQKVGGVVQSHNDTDYDLATGKPMGSHPVLKRLVNPKLAADYFDRNRKAPATW